MRVEDLLSPRFYGSLRRCRPGGLKRTSAVLCVVLSGLVILPGPLWGAAGDLDPTFGTGGTVTTDISGDDDFAFALALQPDGKLVAAGHTDTGGAFAVVRYNSDGSLDAGFGTAGIVTAVVELDGEIHALALQVDGKLVAAGSAVDSGGVSARDFALVRYDTKGTLDASFDGDGIVTTPIGATQSDEASAVAIQSDGKIVAAGFVNTGTNLDVALARYNSDGSLDGSFGTGGIVTTDNLGSTDTAVALVIQPDDKLVAAGSSATTGDPNVTDFLLVRYGGSDGLLDGSFGTGGIVTSDFGGGEDRAIALVRQLDTKLVAAGWADVGGSFDFALARYDTNGNLDATFDGDGIVTTDLGGTDRALALVLQPDGKLVAAGRIDTGGTGSLALVRYNSDGSLDTGFGTNGRVIAPIGPTEDRARALVIQPDGKLVTAGWLFNGTDQDFALARYLGAECGDGITGVGEQCDDGNTAPGDGCDENCQVEIQCNQMYWGDAATGKVQRADLCGSSPVDIVGSTPNESPEGIALDSNGGKLYWTPTSNDVVRANLDGSGRECVFCAGSNDPLICGLTVDASTNTVYWADAGCCGFPPSPTAGKIQYVDIADLDDGPPNAIQEISGISPGCGLALDDSAGKIYWTDFAGSTTAGMVRRTTLPPAGTSKDCTDPGLPPSDACEDLATGLAIPAALALDIGAGKMYFTENQCPAGSLQRADLNGANVEILATGLHSPVGLALDLGAGKLYRTEEVSGACGSGGRIQRSNLDGTSVEDVVCSGLGNPFGIALDLTVGTCDPCCGDGVVNECSEECDDGNTADGDGCSGACRKEGFCEDNLTCQPPCDEDADCAPSCGLCIRCGDGRTDTGEACDDGDMVCGDPCDPNCTVPGCGNGFICTASGEVCDDGNTDAGDGCSPTCTCEGTCGDGIPNLVEGCEECDADGANCPLGTCCESGCAADCTQMSRCTGTFGCCVTVADCPPGEGCCGDGVKDDPPEECDDGNAVRGDGCNELCQRECAQPLPRATPSPVSDTELKCQKTINKETSKFANAKVKALQKCAEAIIKDKTTTDPGPGGRVNFCLTDQSDGFALKAQFKIDKAASKIGAKIAKVCGGDDRVCGTFELDEATPDAIGFPGTCPGFEGRGSCTGGSNNRAICSVDSDCSGGGTCATCDGPIDDCDDIATCVACIGESAIDQAIVLYYDSLADVPAGDLQKCQTTIGKEATKYVQLKEKNLQKCWDKALKGKHTDRCPDFTASVDSTAHKAAEKIARAEAKMISKICRKCGGADRQCDDPIRVVNPLTPPFPGSGGGDDPDPTTEIGFPTTCDPVTVPGGPACGIGVNTVADLVSCISCVTEFKVDCIDAARMPELQGRVYPCECNP